MERIVGSQHLEVRYFERMASSLGDKSRLLKYLPPIVDPQNPPKILDVGAGGGEFANALSLLGYYVVALDASEEATNRIGSKFSNLETICALANHTHDFGTNEFDVIICSSVLHEVFSYGDNIHSRGHISSIVRALDSFKQALKPGGKLLIRDGVLPDNWEETASVQLLGDVPSSVVHTYLDMCPFSNGSAYGNQGTLVSLTESENKTFVGNVRSVLEFSYTYTWGLDSYPRETQELYAVMTLNEYKELLESLGFKVDTAFSYLQPGYPEHLNGVLDLKVKGEPAEWFDSNAIWVAELK